MKTLFGASILSFSYSFLFVQFLVSFIYEIGSGFNVANFIILFVMGPFVIGYLKDVVQSYELKAFLWIGASIVLSIVSYAILLKYL